MPSPPEAVITVPVVDAAEVRDLTLTTVKLPEWLIAQLITYTAYLQHPRFWYGTEEEVNDALADVGEGVIQLMLPVETDPEMFDPSFEVQGDDLFWRFNDESSWINAGEVRGEPGEDGETPQLTVEAHALSSNLPPTADIDGTHIDFGIPRGQDGEDGEAGSGAGASLWVPPGAASDDQLCTAARILADVFSDRLQDNLEIIDAATTTAAQTIDAFLDSVGGVIPIGVPIAASVVEFLFEGITEPMIDYVRENAYDLEARALVRNQMYCAMKIAPNLYDFFDYIDWSEAVPLRTFDLSDPLVSVWENMGEWLEFVFDSLDGTNAGWMTLAYGWFMTKTVDHLVNMEDSAKAMLGYAINTADFGDVADCASAPCENLEWCYTFDLTSDDTYFSAATGYSNTWQSGTGFPGNPTAPNQDRNFVKVVFPFNVELLEISFELDANAGTRTHVWICPGVQAPSCDFQDPDTTDTVFYKTVSGIYTSIAFGVEQLSETSKVGNIIALTLRGTGENPFAEEDNC